MTYKIRWRRRIFWRSRTVIGHRFDGEQGKMILYAADGSIEEIVRWKDCSCRLGLDWLGAMKKSLEAKAGQTVPLNL